MSLMITVADYPAHPEWADLIRANRKRFCKLGHGFQVVDMVDERLKKEFSDTTGPSWARIDLIIEGLKNVGRVIWVDADAVLLNDICESDLPNCLAMAHDAGGINDGITVTVKQNINMWRIVKIVSPIYKNHPVMAQGVMQDMNPIHEVLALDVWNARWDCSYAKIRHFVGMPNDVQFGLVKAECERLKNR
jgi:hypothetical protein